MAVRMLETPYQSAGEKSHIKNWLNKTVGLRLDKVNTGDDGSATSIAVTVFTAADLAGLDKDEKPTGESARIESARIMGQLTGFDLGDVIVVHVVPLGKRGQVLSPPPEGDKDAEALAKGLA